MMNNKGPRMEPWGTPRICLQLAKDTKQICSVTICYRDLLGKIITNVVTEVEINHSKSFYISITFYQ